MGLFLEGQLVSFWRGNGSLLEGAMGLFWGGIHMGITIYRCRADFGGGNSFLLWVEFIIDYVINYMQMQSGF